MIGYAETVERDLQDEHHAAEQGRFTERLDDASISF